MIEAAFVGGLLAFGVWLILRGAFPPPAELSERIAELDNPLLDYNDQDVEEASFNQLRERLAMYVLRAVRGEKMAQTRADVAVARVELTAFAIDKLSGAVGVAVMVATLGLWLGFLTTLSGTLLFGLAGAAFGYIIPDFEISKKARQGRVDFERALNAFVGLVSVSMSGGGGLNTAMSDAAMVGNGWVFDMLRSTLSDAELRGQPAWQALNDLGRRLDVNGLIELGGALGLAGNSGARVTETLISRAESGRKREIAEVQADAERTTANLGVPVGTLVMGWLGFLGYPAVVSLISGFT